MATIHSYILSSEAQKGHTNTKVANASIAQTLKSQLLKH